MRQRRTPQQREEQSAAQQRRWQAKAERAAQDRARAYGRLVWGHVDTMTRIVSEVRHVAGAPEVSLHLVRDGQHITAVQWFTTPVAAVDAATEMIGQIRHEVLA